MRDFCGHELQVGDIAIAAEVDDPTFYLVRVVEVNVMIFDIPSVRIKALADFQNPRSTLHSTSSTQLIWYSSDYANVPDRYAWDVLKNMEDAANGQLSPDLM